jgi:hypothetical protein
MEKLINKIGGPKIATLIAIVLAVLLIFGATLSGQGDQGASDYGSHGHEH